MAPGAVVAARRSTGRKQRPAGRTPKGRSRVAFQAPRCPCREALRPGHALAEVVVLKVAQGGRKGFAALLGNCVRAGGLVDGRAAGIVRRCEALALQCGQRGNRQTTGRVRSGRSRYGPGRGPARPGDVASCRHLSAPEFAGGPGGLLPYVDLAAFLAVLLARTRRASSSAARRVAHQPGKNQDRGYRSTSRSTQQRAGRHSSCSRRRSTRRR
jgi:hypothetical protein